MIGKHVICYQKVRGMPPPPFIAKIVGDLGSRWLLGPAIPGQAFQALKGACSTKPIHED